ncbi:MAG TPA: cytochrome c biogenesis protein CcdA, partial [Gemmatimonadales bacterium]|nr:cytochrome c biogenesis protein CcdA [Gemmatimonadales bacterium]
MSEPVTLGIVVAFAAGVLSFLSPCVLPLVPSYIGFLTGMTLPEIGTRRRAALLHALLFVLGFSLVFILLGATATALGRALGYYQVWLQRAGGVLIILFGLLCLGVLSARPLLSEHRMQLKQKPLGYLGSAVVGMAFAAGWTPCIGPVLGGIL